uniref:Uncharacterized protein n=1 Tax=Micrococcus sp. V7 TaxID=404582 RepID=U5NWK4_9MICC|nr:hypothetical protein LMV7_p00570 [Micrococcus sp. V7]
MPSYRASRGGRDWKTDERESHGLASAAPSEVCGSIEGPRKPLEASALPICDRFTKSSRTVHVPPSATSATPIGAFSDDFHYHSRN